MYQDMPCEEIHEIRAKVEITQLLVNTIFQTTRTTNFLPRDKWVQVNQLVRDLIKLVK